MAWSTRGSAVNLERHGTECLGPLSDAGRSSAREEGAEGDGANSVVREVNSAGRQVKGTRRRAEEGWGGALEMGLQGVKSRSTGR